MSAAAVLAAIAGLALTPSHAAAPPRGNAADYVTVEKDAHSGVWWFKHRGERFFSTGVSNVNNGGADDGTGGVLSTPCQQQENTTLCGDTNNWDMALHFAPYYNITQALFNTSERAWAADSITRLQSWHFNTLGGYSAAVAERTAGQNSMYYNHLLMFATRFAMPAGTPLQRTTAGGCFAYDVFSDEFAAASDAYAAANVPSRAEDPSLLGWHFEKEVSWSKMDLRFWFSPTLAPELKAGVANATAFLHEAYNGSVAALNAAWNCRMAAITPAAITSCINPPGYVADCGQHWNVGPPGLRMEKVTADSETFLVTRFAKRYFDVVTKAIRKYDPNHLLLGMRGGCFGSTALLTLFASYVDVYDFHGYVLFGCSPPANAPRLSLCVD